MWVPEPTEDGRSRAAKSLFKTFKEKSVLQTCCDTLDSALQLNEKTAGKAVEYGLIADPGNKGKARHLLIVVVSAKTFKAHVDKITQGKDTITTRDVTYNVIGTMFEGESLFECDEEKARSFFITKDIKTLHVNFMLHNLLAEEERKEKEAWKAARKAEKKARRDQKAFVSQVGDMTVSSGNAFSALQEEDAEARKRARKEHAKAKKKAYGQRRKASKQAEAAELVTGAGDDDDEEGNKGLGITITTQRPLTILRVGGDKEEDDGSQTDHGSALDGDETDDNDGGFNVRVINTMDPKEIAREAVRCQSKHHGVILFCTEAEDTDEK